MKSIFKPEHLHLYKRIEGFKLSWSTVLSGFQEDFWFQ